MTSGPSDRQFDPQSARKTLFAALAEARDAKGGAFPVLEDQDRKPLSYDDLLRAAFALGGKLKEGTRRGERVGIMLPTGIGAAVVFFALHAIGRVPAMLNFTAGARALKGACEAAGVRRVLTARRFIEVGKLDDLASDLSAFAELVYLEDVRPKIGLADKIVAVAKAAAPALFAPHASPDDPAVILFTSGSFGAPRGVVLSHANLIANVRQTAAHIPFDPAWTFFNPLPIFHSFGLTGGLLLPLFTGHRAVLYPSPLHFKEIPALVRDTRANVLLATDTFAGHYARAAAPDDFKSVAFAVLGAERVRDETRALYSTKFDIELLEGYGATEAAPVIAVNLPGANRFGSVGRLVPGVERRLEPVEGVRADGRLFIRGPNVMRGYLGADGALEPPVDGWHDTGDVVDIDADGFVFIRGRVKRFAKIGGEMVSLAAVETFAAIAWPDFTHAAISTPDPRKGERLVLFTDYPDANAGDLLAWMQANGVPEIAAPKRVIALAELPRLGSGKIDYVALKERAEARSDAAEAA